MKNIRLRTYAKVNLSLTVLGRRPDGYHELETILHGVGLADDLEIEVTDTGEVEVDMEVAGELIGAIPSPHENLIYRAARELAGNGAAPEGIRVRVLKRIPIGAGLGGGSGNAAGALFALNELWEMSMEQDRLHEVATRIGSDVPYCLRGGTVLATAKGEELTSLPAPEPMHFVLGFSKEPLSTRAVYEHLDVLDQPRERLSAPMTMALGAGDIGEIASLLQNDLETPAFGLRPELEGKKAAMLEAGAIGSLLSGSGPTIFGIAENESHAREIADAVGSAFDEVSVVASKDVCIERVEPASEPASART